MQIACLRLVADLKKTEQIAGELCISPSTVNTHIERAIARLQVPNRREAARLVVAYDATRTVAGNALPPAPFPAAPLDASALKVGRPEKQPTEELPLSATADSAPTPRPPTTAVGRRRNDLTVPQRLLLAIVLLVLLCIGIAGLGAAIEQLRQWRASLAPTDLSLAPRQSGPEIPLMNNDLTGAFRAVQAHFLPAEQSTDRAAAETARLLATILEQRAAAGLAIGTGAPLIRKLSKSLTAQIEAREEFIMAHKLAAAMPAQLGMEPTQFGDTDACPPDDRKRLMAHAAEASAGQDNVIRLAVG